jgi:hypothetical protein
VDNIRDLHIPTEVSFLTSHRCYKAAGTVPAFANDCQRAGKPFLLRANADGLLALLDLPGLKVGYVADLLKVMSGTHANISPQRLTNASISAAKAANLQLTG